MMRKPKHPLFVTPRLLMTSRWFAEFVLLAALWGSSFLFMRLGASEFGPLATAGVRVAVAALCLWPLLLLKGQWPALRRHWRPVLVSGIINSALPFALYSWAVLSINTGLAAILNATTPLFGALVTWVWLREPPGRLRGLGLVIGFAGVACLAWDKVSFHAGGSGGAILACLAAPLCYGIAASLAKRQLSGVPALVTATGSQLGAALALLPFTLWTWPAQAPSTQAWLAVISMAVFCTALAYVLYFRLIEHAGPSKALTVTFVTPLFAVTYGTIFLQEAVTPWMLLSGGIILVGTALSTGLIQRHLK